MSRQLIHSFAQIPYAGCSVRREQSPLTRGRGTSAATFKQPYAQNGFKLANRLRYRRLRDREAVGGALHAAELRHRQKALQMPKLDPAAGQVGEGCDWLIRRTRRNGCG